MLRRSLVLFGGAALTFGTFAGLGVTASAAPTTQTFSFTGAPETFTVPANVCQITVAALGAQGGIFGEGPAPVGGEGGSATATLAVTPGELLQVNVGGQGQAGAPGGAGGFNGGGDGGSGAGAPGGGGGASDVRRSPYDAAGRLIVAGGGGGASGTEGGFAGGAGGGATGGDGGAGSSAGLGGSQTSGGLGGSGSGAGETGDTDGLGIGGTGGFGNGSGQEAGGGGGGGFHGGGGGGGDDTGGGGGGGSGFTPDGAGLIVGGHTGDGEVTITFDPAAGTCPAPAPGQPGAPGAAVAVTAAPLFTG